MRREGRTPSSSPKQKSIAKSGHIELRKDDFSKEERDEYLERVYEDERYKKEVGTHNDWVAAQKLRESSRVALSNLAQLYFKNEVVAARKFDKAVEIERSVGNQSPGTPSSTLKPNQDLSSQMILNRILKQYGKDSELFKYTQVIQKIEGNQGQNLKMLAFFHLSLLQESTKFLKADGTVKMQAHQSDVPRKALWPHHHREEKSRRYDVRRKSLQKSPSSETPQALGLSRAPSGRGTNVFSSEDEVPMSSHGVM